jgi:ATP-dependent DNA helicase RecG
MGASERAGSGGKEIFNVVERNNFRAPDLDVTLESTSLKLWCAAPENAYIEYNENIKPVLFYIKENYHAKMKDLKDNTGLSDHHIHKAIKTLLDDDIIYVVGKGRATTYYWNPTAIERVANAKTISKILLGK